MCILGPYTPSLQVYLGMLVYFGLSAVPHFEGQFDAKLLCSSQWYHDLKLPQHSWAPLLALLLQEEHKATQAGSAFNRQGLWWGTGYFHFLSQS